MAKLKESRVILYDKRWNQWKAIHNCNQIGGPEKLIVNDSIILQNLVDSVDNYRDDRVLMNGLRSWRKAGMTVVAGKGTSQGEKGILFSSVSRYGSNFIKLTTDISIPKGTVVRSHVDVASLAIGPTLEPFTLIAIIDNQIKASTWKSIPKETINNDILFCSQETPLSVIFKGNQMELEILTGVDLWRWDRGVNGQLNLGKFELKKDHSQWVFNRAVSFLEAPIEPIPRVYRFTSYISWIFNKPQNQTPEYRREKAQWKNGTELNFDLLVKWIKDRRENTAFEIDLSDISWPQSCLRKTKEKCQNNIPCFAHNGTINIVKRIVRQIASVSTTPFPVVFKGLNPGVCHKGSHLGRKGCLRHWDLPAIMDLARWIRGNFTPDYEIYNDDGLHNGPSMRNLFSVSQIGLEHATRP